MNTNVKLTDTIDKNYKGTIEFICNGEHFGYFNYKGGEEKVYNILFKVIKDVNKDMDYSPLLQFVKRIEELNQEKINEAAATVFKDFTVKLG